MTQNNSNLPAGQSEYRYREDQPGEYAEPPTQQAINAQMVKSRMKRMMVPVVLMVVVYLVYHGLTWYAGRTQSGAAEQQKVVQKQLALPSKPQLIVKSTPVAAIPAESNYAAQISRVEDSVREALGNLNQQISDNRDQAARINDTVQQNQNDISEIKQSINMLSASVLKIAEDVQKLSKPKKIKKVYKPKIPPPAYHVVAIVPGRAWLESSEGGTITVRTGDRLEGYGTVEVISPRQGLVITSSGTIIQFGVNDV